MLERMIVKHWIALTVGFTLLGVLIRVRYNTQGHFAIGGEWLAPAFMLFLEWLIRMMRGVLIDAGIIRGHKKRRRKARVQHDRQEVYRTGAVRREKSRGMEYNSKKTKVFSIKEGFTFLGFKYRLTDTGKVIMTVSSEKVKERRRKLRKLVRKAKRGEITKAKVDDCYQAWRSHASKGNSFHLICRMDKFYKSLWNDQETEVTDNEN